MLVHIVAHDCVTDLIETLLNVDQLVLVVVRDQPVELFHEVLLGVQGRLEVIGSLPNWSQCTGLLSCGHFPLNSCLGYCIGTFTGLTSLVLASDTVLHRVCSSRTLR